jgi:hypothetical protein
MSFYKTGDKVIDKVSGRVLHVVMADQLGDLTLVEIVNSRVVEQYQRHKSEVKLYLDESHDLGDVSDHLKT